ncbi:MAG: TetR/AcrR family transcriptional regulator [Proteobacteria bacterium]|nr:TetR/AcrR family transcriptional regulator [Pseudomonadota bacterium]
MLAVMKDAVLSVDKQDTAAIILDAAINRFSEYGYNKTTMAEIANDAGMSAANIYRYFKNKEEIAATCAKNCMSEGIDTLKSVVRDTNQTAQEKLEKYVFTTLQLTQEKALENKKIDEVCTEITKNRPDLVHDKINNEIALLVEVLSYGNQTREFDVNDVVETSTAIHSMLVVFSVPIFMPLFTPEEFEKNAASVIKLLIAGLSNKK